MKMNVAFLIVLLSVLKLTSATATGRQFRNIILDEGTRGEKPGPPISPDIIAAISYNTPMNECLRVYGFLLQLYTSRKEGVHVSLQELNDFGKSYAQEKLQMTTIPKCSTMMRMWNEKLASFDDTHIAKQALRLSLRSIQRKDLEMLLLESEAGRQEHDLHDIETEINSHIHHEKPGKTQSWRTRIHKKENSINWMNRCILIMVVILIPLTLAILIGSSSISKKYLWKKTNNIKPGHDEEEGKPLVV